MRKIKNVLTLFIIFLTLAHTSDSFINPIYADENCGTVTINEHTPPLTVADLNAQLGPNYFLISFPVTDTTSVYHFQVEDDYLSFFGDGSSGNTSVRDGKVTFIAKANIPQFSSGIVWPINHPQRQDITFNIWRDGKANENFENPYCRVAFSTQPPGQVIVPEPTYTPTPTPTNTRTCGVSINPNPRRVNNINQIYTADITANSYMQEAIENGTNRYRIFVYSVSGLDAFNRPIKTQLYRWEITTANFFTNQSQRRILKVPLQTFSEGNHLVEIWEYENGEWFENDELLDTGALFDKGEFKCTTSIFGIGNTKPPLDPKEQAEQDAKNDLKKVCDSLPAGEQSKCQACVSGDDIGNTKAPYPEQIGAYTAIGCIPSDLPTFLSNYLFTIGLGFAGGIAFLLMLWGGFNILISQGDAHKIQMGREIIVSAGLGLLFIIFAIVILQFIGKDLIGIPGFGE